MTYRDAYKLAKQWHRKASIISAFHYKHMLLNKKWRIKDTAKYFDVSVGKVSEDIQLVLKMSSVRQCETRALALILLRSLK